jgi:hypothetical protein
MRFNLKGLYDKNSALLAINEMDDEITTSLRMTPAGITSPDKVRSREQLLKVLGAIPHNGNGKKNGDTNIENVQININTEPVRRALEDVK